MRLTLAHLTALGVLPFMVAGCSSHDPSIDSQDKVFEKDEVRYLNISISNPPSATRAEFLDGTTDENKVTALYFRFYDATGKPVGEAQNNQFTFTDNPAGSNQSVGQIANVVVQLNIAKGAQRPTYVVAFINPVNFEEITAQSYMQDLRNQKRDDYKSNDGDFAMNNSVYYGADPISGASNVKILGAPILADQLYTSEDDAKDNNASSVNIYVERTASKVMFTLADEAVKPQTVGAYTLTFKPVAWSVNADAAEMYASKRFNDSNSETQTIPTFQQVQNMLGNWTTWNDATLHRSYWACSPSYYDTQFPQVSDDIIDSAMEENPPSTGAGEIVAPYGLRYYSYNQITGQSATPSDGKGVTAMNNSGKNWKYVLENTMGAAAFASANPKAAAPSVLLVGEYTVKNGTQTINAPNGFCLYNNNLYFRETVPAGATEGAMTIKDALMQLNQVLAVDQEGTLMKANASANIKQCFDVIHPSKDVRNGQPVPHRYVTLQLKKNLTDADLIGLYFKPIGSDTWQPIKATNITAINRLLWAQLGNARGYTNNKGYFSIPIQHLGISENTSDPSPIDDKGSIDWAKVRVGDFGLVRNHVYSIGVSSIEGLASGIEDLNNPLVPSMEEDTYWVKYKVNILNWRVVPTQGDIILK